MPVRKTVASIAVAIAANLCPRQYATIQAVSAVTVVPPAPRTGAVLRMDAREEPAATGDAVTLSITNPLPPQPAADHSFSFRDVLHALNPLQYMPVVGTIYRALTGDEIPEMLRRAGSLVVSTLVGGPIGAITNIATTILEKITGFDIDKTMQAALGGHPSGTTQPSSAPATSEAATALLQVPAAVAPDAASKPLSSAQLTAYGVSTAKDGTLTMGNVSGADVLNTLELKRIQDISAAYGGAQKGNRPAGAGVAA